jgi:phage baseplate assembly protein W
MDIYGSALSFPIRPDRRGTLATTSDPVEIVTQAIMDIIQTRQGERVMLPDYGIPDFVFSVVDAGFATRFANAVEQQIKRYIPQVEDVRVEDGSEEGGSFVDTPTLHGAAIKVTYTIRGHNVPQNLVYPVWRLRADARQ